MRAVLWPDVCVKATGWICMVDFLLYFTTFETDSFFFLLSKSLP